MSMPWVLVSLRLSLFMYTNVRNQQWGWSQAGSGADEGMAMGVGRCEDRPRQVGGHRCMREWTHGGADSCMQETLMAAVEKWVADSEIKTWKTAGRKMGANSLLRTPRSRFRRRLQIETWKPFFSAMVSCRYWHHTDETVGMRKRSVFKIGGCVHSLIVFGFVGRCFHTFLSLKHFPTRIYWSIASIAAWGHLLFFTYIERYCGIRFITNPPKRVIIIATSASLIGLSINRSENS